jgi:C4-dicarboxylate-specific signal transduction histidine kinase
VQGAVENARILNAGAFTEANVQFSVQCPKDFTVLMREGPLTQVFNNLFDNAAYWLSRKSDEHDRKLKVVVDATKREVLVSDNGPGVFPRYRDRIFRPFFSMKTDGRGLGLYIVREILAEKSAEIRLLEAGEHSGMFHTGASFLICFSEVKS